MSAVGFDDTDWGAPTVTRRAAVARMSLPAGKVPRFGTKSWKREEHILWRGAQMFRCNVCLSVNPAVDGGADDMPDACSKCWVAAHKGESS